MDGNPDRGTRHHRCNQRVPHKSQWLTVIQGDRFAEDTSTSRVRDSGKGPAVFHRQRQGQGGCQATSPTGFGLEGGLLPADGEVDRTPQAHRQVPRSGVWTPSDGAVPE